MRKNIFKRLFLILISVGILPVLVFSFLSINSYQELILKYAPYIQSHPDVISQTQLSYKNVKIQAVLIFLLVVIFVLFFSIVFSRRFLYPIKKLVEGTAALSKGNLKTRIHLKTNDEFEDLADSFNKMAEDLYKSHSALEEAKTILEIKVKARTRELEELNQALEEKVRQRTKELQKKVSDLEKFNKLTVGRELKMVELKRKVKLLSEELEKLKAKCSAEGKDK